jgi:hypothetical protein
MNEGTSDEEVSGGTSEPGSVMGPPADDVSDFREVVTRLRGALGNERGKIRVADVHALAGLSRPSYYRMKLVARAMQHLGWRRSRYRFNGTAGYAYARGTCLQREGVLEIERREDGQIVLKRREP